MGHYDHLYERDVDESGKRRQREIESWAGRLGVPVRTVEFVLDSICGRCGNKIYNEARTGALHPCGCRTEVAR